MSMNMLSRGYLLRKLMDSFLFSPSIIHNSTTSYTKSVTSSTKIFSEMSDDDLQSEATTVSALEILDGGNNTLNNNGSTYD